MRPRKGRVESGPLQPPKTLSEAGLTCLGPIPNNYSDCGARPCQKCDMLGMKHATDMAFDENAPVPENLADLAKAAEDEMKIDAEVMAERR